MVGVKKQLNAHARLVEMTLRVQARIEWSECELFLPHWLEI